MLRTYIDESASNDVYYVASLTIPDESVQNLEHEIRLLQTKIGEIYKLPPNLELHGYEIWHGEGVWSEISLEDRKEIIKYILKVILELDVRIAIKGVRINHFQSKYGKERRTIHNAALVWNLEKVQYHANRVSRRFSLIADESGPNDTYYRDQVNTFKNFETFGWDPETFTNLEGDLKFVSSEMSCGLQAVDVIAYIYQRSNQEVKHPQLKVFQRELVDKLYSSKKLIYLGIWP